MASRYLRISVIVQPLGESLRGTKGIERVMDGVLDRRQLTNAIAVIQGQCTVVRGTGDRWVRWGDKRDRRDKLVRRLEGR